MSMNLAPDPIALRRPPRRGPGALPAGNGGDAARPPAPRIPPASPRRDDRGRRPMPMPRSASSTISSTGADARRDEIDALIADRLAEGWSLDRLDKPMKAILRVGAYELIARPDVPTATVISEYIDVAHAFFDKRETGFVNGLLDAIAKTRARLDATSARPSSGSSGSPPATRRAGLLDDVGGARRPGPDPRQHRRRGPLPARPIRPPRSAGSWSRSISATSPPRAPSRSPR